MDTTSGQEWQRQKREGVHPFLAMGTALVVLAGITLAIFFPPVEGPRTGVPASRKVSALTYPAAIVSELAQPAGDQWLLPAAVTRLGDSRFVLDTGNNRLLELDESGAVVHALGPDLGGARLEQPMGIATDGERLFIANSLPGEVLVLSASGQVEQVIALKAAPGEVTPRPIAIAVGEDGRIVVSDANNHRVLSLDSGGTQQKFHGVGERSSGEDGLNVPAGLAIDSLGDVYVVDMLNGRVVKLSPEGEYLREFGQLADTAGSLARPKAVAVDRAGRVFVSDGLQAAIEVFGADGGYLGMIGRRAPNETISNSIFEAPSGLNLDGDTLLVMDGIAGLITLRLSEP